MTGGMRSRCQRHRGRFRACENGSIPISRGARRAKQMDRSCREFMTSWRSAGADVGERMALKGLATARAVSDLSATELEQWE